jgi:hypothetical protein
MHEVITRIVDDGEFYEVQSEYAGNIIRGFAHIAASASALYQPAGRARRGADISAHSRPRASSGFAMRSTSRS